MHSTTSDGKTADGDGNKDEDAQSVCVVFWRQGVQFPQRGFRRHALTFTKRDFQCKLAHLDGGGGEEPLPGDNA